MAQYAEPANQPALRRAATAQPITALVQDTFRSYFMDEPFQGVDAPLSAPSSILLKELRGAGKSVVGRPPRFCRLCRNTSTG